MSSRQTPPPLPSEILYRVIRLAATDGRMVLWLSGCCALFSAAAHDVIGAVIGCAAAGAGAMELHGSTLLKTSDLSGLRWVIRAQLFLLAAILIYAGINLVSFDPAVLRSHPSELQSFSDVYGLTKEQAIDLITGFHAFFFIIVGVVSVFYQGAMVRYYARRRGAVEQALEDEGTVV